MFEDEKDFDNFLMERADMLRPLIVDYVEEYYYVYLEDRKFYHCLMNDHQDSTPSMRYNADTFSCHCFGCAQDRERPRIDIYNLIQQDQEGVETFQEAVDWAWNWAKERDLLDSVKDYEPSRNSAKPDKPKESHKEYIDFCNAQLLKGNNPGYEYMKARGVTDEQMKRFKFGYDANVTRGTLYDERAVVLPTSEYAFIYRGVEEKKYVWATHSEIFNLDELYRDTKEPIFLVEGVFDALAIMNCGYDSAALITNSLKNEYITLLENNPPKRPILISLDTDERGQKGQESTLNKLMDKDIDITPVTLVEGFKDPSECYCNNRQQLKDSLKAAIESFNIDSTTKYTTEYNMNCNIDNFLKVVNENKERKATPTDFTSLDILLDGGLYPGLYIIGAISSLGKTTFSLQVMDNIAKSGRDVIIFSLEMSKFEMMSKSLSRLSVATEDRKTTREILNGDIPSSVLDQYKREYSSNVYIVDGCNDGITAKDIYKIVKKHIDVTGNTPIVMVDYLQILEPEEMRGTEKQNTDKNVKTLKSIATTFNTTVLAISSFNRENYNNPVSLTSFKESGAIEYSSDVLIGLQYNGMDYTPGEKEKDRRTRIRNLIDGNNNSARQGLSIKVDIKILKNRNGVKGSTSLKFIPKYNLFYDFIGEDDEFFN